MDKAARVLLVEDDPSMAPIYLSYLKGEDLDLEHVSDGAAAVQILRERPPDLLLLDLKLPDMDGFDILRIGAEMEAPTEFVIITGHGSMSTAIEAMQLGARDFLVKPFNKDRLVYTVRNTLERQDLERTVEIYRDEIDRGTFQGFIGSSLAMQAVYRTIESAAKTRATVFITGESGTGKEVCAEAIHMLSNRQRKPFVPLNCGAIPKDLVESEIFGHVKGAFTGAVNDRVGAASQADGGTLFLDEIGEMDVDLQAKLLRFLQTGAFQRVGDSKARQVDVRIVCATNREPLEEVRAGRFREDLYYRLHVLPILLPPLRERDGDALEIAKALLASYAAEEGKSFRGFEPEVERVLVAYDWPGNVRQLQNVVRNIVVLHDGDLVTAEMLPSPLDALLEGGAAPAQHPRPVPSGAGPGDPAPAGSSGPSLGGENEIRSLAEIEREAIERAIEICDGNVPNAAFHLGISAATIYRKKASWRSGA